MKEENQQPTNNTVPEVKQENNLFNLVLQCKESSKELMNKPPKMNSLDEMKNFLIFTEQNQNQCLNLIEKLKNEAKNNEQPQILITALIKTQERILVEQKQIKSFSKESLTKEDATNLGYLQVGIGLVRQQEEIAWGEYKTYLENQRLGIETGFNWSFVFWIMVIGVIMALVKRVQKKEEK